MIRPRALKQGDRVAIVSLSSGMLGEEFCTHSVEKGVKRLLEFGLEPVFMPNARKGIEYLKEHPEARAADLKEAFLDDTIAGIICAIGGDDTYRLLPYLMDDAEFVQAVQAHPKLFTGFSDTTVNHLMFYQLGLATFYGPNFICDLAELGDEMLPYTKEAFLGYFEGNPYDTITSASEWYEERTDFSRAVIGKDRVSHEEKRGFELLQGAEVFEGRLLGGCLESLYDILTPTRYEDEQEVSETYHLFPAKEQWEGTILFIETCEEKPSPELFREELLQLKARGVFDVVQGVLVGKPQDEMYYKEYKEVLLDVIERKDLPILYNVNFGHAYPRCVIPYGMKVRVEAGAKKIHFLEEMFASSISKAWKWEKETSGIWLKPSEESYYIAQRWKEAGRKDILDFGCGLGRHSIYFAKQGFRVSAFDLSVEGTDHLRQWARQEQVTVDVTVADMLHLPYPEDSFDGIFAYHVISHTDTEGMKQILAEITRVLRPGGEIYLTLCSKETWSYKESGYPRLDENTVVKTEEGPENGIPHFYVTLEDILNLFGEFEIERIRHTDDCFFAGKKQNSKHYFVLAKLK